MVRLLLIRTKRKWWYVIHDVTNTAKQESKQTRLSNQRSSTVLALWSNTVTAGSERNLSFPRQVLPANKALMAQSPVQWQIRHGSLSKTSEIIKSHNDGAIIIIIGLPRKRI